MECVDRDFMYSRGPSWISCSRCVFWFGFPGGLSVSDGGSIWERGNWSGLGPSFSGCAGVIASNSMMRWAIGVVGEEETSALRDSDSGCKDGSERVSSVPISSESGCGLGRVSGGIGSTVGGH